VQTARSIVGTAAPTPTVVIVGGGFTGAVVAAQIARMASFPVLLEVVEPREALGGGVAYSAADPAHRINVAAVRMTVFAEDPGHFDRWLRERGGLDADPAALWSDGSAFPQRRVFGRYVAGQLDAAVRARPGVSLRHHRTRAVEIVPRARGFAVRLEQGGVLEADVVVLAVSHPPPCVPRPLQDLVRQGARVIANPWQAGALAAIAPEHDVLIVGTGLTMADVAATLDRTGHRGQVVALSRRGLLSRGHAFGAVAKRAWFATAIPPTTARGLCRAVRAQIDEARAQGEPWQAVLDDIRLNARRLWQALPEAEQRRVVRHLRPFWDVHRFRVAPQIEASIARLRDAGQLRCMAARLRGAEWDGRRIAVRVQPRGRPETMLAVDAVVVTTGPGHGEALASNPALASLARAGLLQADRVGLGLEVDAGSRAVGPDGVRDDLLVAGPLARGRFGELMGLPQVSEHAAEVAAAVVRVLQQAVPAPAAANDAASRPAAAFPP
jgi:uncharacterized NAD(P)/FAD-binding protein YdhS